MKSEMIDQLAVALVKAQSEMPAVAMNSVNPFLKNKYADLGEMIKTATPVLGRNGLAVSQQVVTEEDRIGVTTTLIHSSGQWIESTVSLPLSGERGKNIAQEAGSVITYLRRYSFGGIVGLYTDEDVDGNKAENGHKPENGTAKTQTQPRPTNSQQVQQQTASAPASPAVMTLEFAENEKNGEGIRYGDMPDDRLKKMIADMKKIRTFEPDSWNEALARKLDAAETIIKARSEQAHESNL